MAPLLKIENLKTWFPIRRGILSRTVSHVRAVDGVSLGLVGESGCGKTTLARTVSLLDTAHSGSVFFDGQDLLQMAKKDVRAARRRLQIIFQDPFSSLNPRMTVCDIITEGLVQHRMIKPREREQAARQLLNDVGMGEDALHRYPHEFSGGQRQRISIARAISMKPDLIICDEAVSALDVSVQAQVINLLKDLRDKYNLSYLFISHDLSVVRHIADRTAVMYVGRVVEEGKTDDIIDNPQHPYTRALISAVPRVGSTGQKRTILHGDAPSPSTPPSGCRFHPRCPEADAACAQTMPQLTDSATMVGHQTACLHRNTDDNQI